MPLMQLNVVDLPAPFGPMKPRISSSWTAKERSSTAVMPPKFLVRSDITRMPSFGPSSSLHSGGASGSALIVVTSEEVAVIVQNLCERSHHLAAVGRHVCVLAGPVSETSATEDDAAQEAARQNVHEQQRHQREQQEVHFRDGRPQHGDSEVQLAEEVPGDDEEDAAGR